MALPAFFRSRVTWVLAAVMATPLVILGWMWWAAHSELSTRLAALRAKGLPTTAREVNDFYVVPRDVPDTTALWVDAIGRVEAAGLSVRGKDLPILGTDPRPIPPPGQPWKQRTAARALLDELGPQLAAVWKAAEAGGQARFPVDFSAGIQTLLPNTQRARSVARLLVLDAHVAAHEGDGARALKDLKAVFALSDALRGEPILVSQLVRIAIHAVGCDAVERLLPYGGWTDPELESLQVAIHRAQFRTEISRALAGERATCLTALDSVPLGPFGGSNAIQALDLFEESIESFSGTWPQTFQKQRDISDRIRGLAGSTWSRLGSMGVLMLMPALESGAKAGGRAEARQTCTAAGLAAWRYRIKKGHLPVSLKDLGDELLAVPSSSKTDALTDPLSGRPLRYKREKASTLIYSVGEDELDDGGDVDRDSDRRMKDVGFRIPE